jgi:tetratricopeptide (TPR) repeat protein
MSDAPGINRPQIGVLGDYAQIKGGIHFYGAGDSPSGKPLLRPPPVEHFKDRETELEELLCDLRPGQVVTLCGPGGIGKSALAAEAIWRMSPGNEPPEQFPDGIIWHDFYTEARSDIALENIARCFGEEPVPSPVAAAKRALAGKHVLLFLDGTEDTDNLPAVLSIRGSCGVLVTSRKRKDALAEWQDIESLDLDEAVKLLQAWGGEQAADEQAVRRICELTGGLPLAVRIAGHYLKMSGETASEYLEWLEETPLEALDQGNRKFESVSLLLKRSLDQVGESARDILSVTGLLAFSPFSRDVLAEALLETKIRRPLNDLISYGLLMRYGDRYQLSHALIHTYLRKMHKPPEEVVKRLAAYYDTFAREQREKGLEGYTRLDAERAHLMGVLDHCRQRRYWKSISNLVWAAEDYLAIRGYWTERRTALEAGAEAARNIKDRYDEGAFLGNLGLAYSDLGEVEKAIAYYEQALEIAREIGHRQGEGNRLGNLGNAYSALGEVEKAIAYYEQALEIDREIGHRQGEGNHLGNLGNAYSDLGEVEKAIAYYEQALEIDREIGYRQGEGADLGNLGLAYSALGEVEKAIAYYEQALEIAREIGHRQGEGNHLGNLGLAYSDLGEVEKARQYLQESLAIFEEIKSPNADRVRKWLADIVEKESYCSGP